MKDIITSLGSKHWLIHMNGGRELSVMPGIHHNQICQGVEELSGNKGTRCE